MQKVQKLIQSGQGRQARERFARLLFEQPEKTEKLYRTLTKFLVNSYLEFHVAGVHEFCNNQDVQLPAEVLDSLKKMLGHRIQRTRYWMRTLHGITQERLGRECRAFTTLGNPKQASARALALLRRAGHEEEARQRATFLVHALADLRTDRQTAISVLDRVAESAEVYPELSAELPGLFVSVTQDETPQTQFESTSQAWLRQLNEAIISLRAWLPEPTATGDPTPAEMTKFYDELHAILRAGMASSDREDLVDALWIITEYCPCPVDQQTIQNVAGVEDRIFGKLGPRARLTCVRVIRRLGELGPLRREVLNLAEQSEDDIYMKWKLLSAVMGGLSHRDFYPYLDRQLNKTSDRSEAMCLIDALSRIANPEAVSTLLDLLSRSIRNRRDHHHEQRAEALLEALGRVCRSQHLQPEQRNRLLRQIIEICDVEDRQIAFRAAHQLFTSRLGEIEHDLKAWAAEKAVAAMWGHPPKGVQTSSPTVNGWREPMVTTLRRLGKEVMPEVLESAERHAARLSGAMGAVAHYLEEFGDERAAELLEKMIRIALMHQDNGRQSKLLQEQMLDPASGRLRELDRDDLIHTMLHTLYQIGGRDGLNIIMDFADQVQAGRIDMPGPRTSDILVNTKLKHGKMGEATRRAKASKISASELRKLMSEARGGLFSKRPTRISAIARLGQARRPDALKVLLECLADKDPMISNAAQTALAQYFHPLPDEREYNAILDGLFAHPQLFKKTDLREAFLEFARREFPKKPPYDKILERQLEVSFDDENMKRTIHTMALTTYERGLDSWNEESGEAASPQETSLDRKRAYLQARREWIAGGKQGEPPKPP